jgi:hypothetical protein
LVIDLFHTFLLIEPAAEVEINVTRFFRIALGTSYRFPAQFESGSSGTPQANPESLKGFSYNLTFKFGKF